MKQRCSTCRYWRNEHSESMGVCVTRLNTPTWKDYGRFCPRWERVGPIEEHQP